MITQAYISSPLCRWQYFQLSIIIMGLGVAYARVGLVDKAMECVPKLEQRQQEEPDSIVDGDLVRYGWVLATWIKLFTTCTNVLIKEWGRWPVSLNIRLTK